MTQEQEDRLETKTQAVQEALKGFHVQYASHNTRSLVPDMARVFGYSIIWHEGAYSNLGDDTVEVRIPNGDVIAHQPIKELRALVAGATIAPDGKVFGITYQREDLTNMIAEYMSTRYGLDNKDINIIWDDDGHEVYVGIPKGLTK